MLLKLQRILERLLPHKKEVGIPEHNESLSVDISKKANFCSFAILCFSESVSNFSYIRFPFSFNMSSNIDIITVDVSIFEDLTIFVMSL